jgi:thiol:disulfide interchange protein DsbC
MGVQLGVQGTPAIFLANGTLIAGYKPAKVLAEEAIANP